ncbi:uncharacterized protein [Pithys albifrons albifrons]|uniref:uncharacterized protein n=1 Tax=Pithys albifrons albifrons TaxID=3385563 RepID=UPI003A5CE5E0
MWYLEKVHDALKELRAEARFAAAVVGLLGQGAGSVSPSALPLELVPSGDEPRSPRNVCMGFAEGSFAVGGMAARPRLAVSDLLLSSEPGKAGKAPPSPGTVPPLCEPPPPPCGIVLPPPLPRIVPLPPGTGSMPPGTGAGPSLIGAAPPSGAVRVFCHGTGANRAAPEQSLHTPPGTALPLLLPLPPSRTACVAESNHAAPEQRDSLLPAGSRLLENPEAANSFPAKGSGPGCHSDVVLTPPPVPTVFSMPTAASLAETQTNATACRDGMLLLKGIDDLTSDQWINMGRNAILGSKWPDTRSLVCPIIRDINRARQYEPQQWKVMQQAKKTLQEEGLKMETGRAILDWLHTA